MRWPLRKFSRWLDHRIDARIHRELNFRSEFEAYWAQHGASISKLVPDWPADIPQPPMFGRAPHRGSCCLMRYAPFSPLAVALSVVTIAMAARRVGRSRWADERFAAHLDVIRQFNTSYDWWKLELDVSPIGPGSRPFGDSVGAAR